MRARQIKPRVENIYKQSRDATPRPTTMVPNIALSITGTTCNVLVSLSSIGPFILYRYQSGQPVSV